MADIDNVTAREIQQAALDIFALDRMTTLIYE